MVKVHVVSLPHTQVTRAFDWCAYTAKVRRFSAMLAACNYKPITYCGMMFEGTGAHIPIVYADDRKKWFGTNDWPVDQVFDRWQADDPCWQEMNQRAVTAIRDRWQPGDMVGIIAGRCQQTIVDAFPGELAVEWGVGYEGVLDQTQHAFESSAWRHYVYGTRRWDNGRHFDTVIPNAFDPADYTTGPDDGYLLFLGRHTARKGLAVVTELAQNHKVITAGQGGPLPGIEYRGVVVGNEKRDLLARATAVLVPTLYIEPFGGVAVEAMLSGVPAITTNFGAFTETVDQGVTGFRCDTLGEFVDAVNLAPSIRGISIREQATRQFGVAAVAPLYYRWLTRCALLHGEGWYTQRRP